MLSQLVLILVSIICVSRATVSDSCFNVVGGWQSLTGKVAAEFKTRINKQMCQNRNKMLFGGIIIVRISEIRVILDD